MVAFLDYLPRGNTLSDQTWKRRHTTLQWVLLAHLPGLLVFGVARGYALDYVLEAVTAPAACLLVSRVLRSRRLAALAVTAGLVYCSAALVVLSGGSIEAHFHFFVMIGFIALYQDWVPFVWNVLFTILSHGVGSWLMPGRIFDHASGQQHPWTWSLIHGVAVLAGCVGVIVFWRNTEDEQRRAASLRSELSESNRRRFTADLLVNLARRNQNLIYRQLDLLNRLEEHEPDAEQLSHLFQLDHLATRIRRNAESLLVLSGEEPARKWGRSVLLVDVVRAAIAEIEELDRVDFAVDESLAVSGRAVADCTHLLAELIENAVRFSPPGLSVMVRTRPYQPQRGTQVLTVEDWGVGMSQTDLADANDLLRRPRDVDLATSQRLGLHVVARLAHRYGIGAALETTPGGGVTAVVVLPAALFVAPGQPVDEAPAPARHAAVGPGVGRAGAGYSNGRAPAGRNASNAPAARNAAVVGWTANGHGPAVGHRPAVGHDDPSVASNYPSVAGNYPSVAGHDSSVASYDPTVAGHDPAANGRTDTGAPGPTLGGHRTSPAEGAGAPVGPPDSNWRSWWTEPTAHFGPGTAVDALDDLAPRRPAAGPTPGAPAEIGDLGEFGLARRTPQANLADELRRSPDTAQAALGRARPERDPLRARSALSRFQATQRAARQGERPGPGTDGEDRL